MRACLPDLSLLNHLHGAVYLLEEIWQSVHGSGPEVSHAYVEAAHKRLSHKSPVVKQKVTGCASIDLSSVLLYLEHLSQRQRPCRLCE